MIFFDNILGNCIEILCTFLLLHWFSKDYWKKRAPLWGIVFVWTLGGAILEIWIHNSAMIPLLYFLSISLCLGLVTKRKLSSILFEILGAAFVLDLSEFFLLDVVKEFSGKETVDFRFLLLNSILVTLLCFWMFTRKKWIDRFRIYYDQNQSAFFLVIINLTILMQIQLGLWKHKDQSQCPRLDVALLFIALWIALNLFMLYQLVKSRQRERKLKLEKMYGEMAERLQDSLRAEQHEFKKHLQTIWGLTYQEEPQEAVKMIQMYMEEYKKENRTDESRTFHTGRRILDAFLYAKQKEEKAFGIKLRYIPAGEFPDFPMDAYELVELVGNLLNNACDYVKGLPVSERKVFLNIKNEQSQKIMEVKNSFQSDIKLDWDKACQKGYTTKPGRQRGYGLPRTKTIAEKYGGSLEIAVEGEYLVIQVVFG